MQIISYSQCSSNSIIIVTLGELYPEPDPQNGHSKDSNFFDRRLKPDPQDGYPKNSDNKFDLEWTYSKPDPQDVYLKNSDIYAILD